MKTLTYILSAVLTAAMLPLITQSAQAQDIIREILQPITDEKVVPGNACQPVLGAQAGDFNHLQQALVNVANGQREVTCPIVRDNTVNTNGTWNVAVTGFGQFGTVTCTVYSIDQFGFFQDMASASVNTRFRSFTLVLDNLFLGSLDVSARQGFYTLRCSLPANARLFSYRWTEFMSTDRNS